MIRYVIAIRQAYQVWATQVQDRYRLERATCGKRCPRHGDRDRVVGFDWLTLNRVQFASKYTCRLLLRVDHWPPDVKERFTYFNQVISLDCLARDQDLLNKTPTATGRRKPFVVEDPRSRDGSSGQKARESRSTFGQGDLLQIRVTHIEHPTSIQVIA